VPPFDDPLVQVAGAQARIDGIDPATAVALVNFGVRTGSLATLRGNAVFASTLQASRHGWHIGSPVTINSGQGPPSTLRVAGTFTDKRFLGDDYLMPIQTLFRDMPDHLGDASMLLIRAAPGAHTGSIRAAITTLLSRYPQITLLTAAEYQSVRAADLGDISDILAMFTALVALTEILAALGIASALTLSVTERSREFAVLRALGLTRHQLAAMIRADDHQPARGTARGRHRRRSRNCRGSYPHPQPDRRHHHRGITPGAHRGSHPHLPRRPARRHPPRPPRGPHPHPAASRRPALNEYRLLPEG